MTKLRLTILCLLVGLMFAYTALYAIIQSSSNDLRVVSSLFSAFMLYGLYYSYSGAIEDMKIKDKLNS
jgi:hypothetical protein